MVRTVRWAGVILASTMIFSLAGCGSTPASRVAQVQTVLTAAQEQAETVRSVVTQLDTAAGEAQTLLSDPNLPASVRTTILATAGQAQAQLDKYRPTLAALDTRIVQLQELLAKATTAGTDLTVAQELQAYGQGISLTSGILPAPANALVALVGAALTLFGGVVGSVARAKKDNTVLQQQQQQGDAVVSGIVGSVNALLQSAAVPNPDAAKQVLQDYQTENCPDARLAVRKAQGLTA